MMALKGDMMNAFGRHMPKIAAKSEEYGIRLHRTGPGGYNGLQSCPQLVEITSN